MTSDDAKTSVKERKTEDLKIPSASHEKRGLLVVGKLYTLTPVNDQ
jgi:hypothetical protein